MLDYTSHRSGSGNQWFKPVFLICHFIASYLICIEKRKSQLKCWNHGSVSCTYIESIWSPATLLLASVNVHTFIHYAHSSIVGPVIQISSGTGLSVNICVVDRVNRIIHIDSAGGNNILYFRENAVNIEPSPGATDMTLIAIPFAPGYSLSLTAPWVMWAQVICSYYM